MADNIVVINRGSRIFKLKPGADGKPRNLEPGKSIETLDDEEARQLLNYPRDIQDASKVVPVNAAKVKALQDQIAHLTKENERLEAAQAKPAEPAAPAAQAPAESEAKPSRKKGK